MGALVPALLVRESPPICQFRAAKENVEEGVEVTVTLRKALPFVPPPPPPPPVVPFGKPLQEANAKAATKVMERRDLVCFIVVPHKDEDAQPTRFDGSSGSPD